MLQFPTSEDRLFRNDLPDWTGNAWLSIYKGKFSPYADGYREGAKALAQDCIDDRGLNDILIYPVVFLYRQYIELRLKEIIIGLRYCNGRQRSFPQNHHIDQLWNTFKSDYALVGESVKSEDFKHAERLIKEFCQVDPLATGFRYPVDKEGEHSLYLEHIHIQNFAEVMERLANFLDAVSDHVAHMTDIASDMYREYLSNIEW